LSFLGAAQQVTGSRYLLEAGGRRVMIDCGMFQERPFLDRNWERPVVDPKSIDALVLTHAHLDHVGLVPRLVKQGYAHPILCTEPTVELARLIMLDAGRIQEEDAAYKAKRHRREKRSGPHPEIPLYTEADAQRVTPLLHGVPYGAPRDLGGGVTVTFHEAGHILGSAIVVIEAPGPRGRRTIVFSGDLGQWHKPLVRDPTLLDRADAVVMESTYGDRNHRDGGDIGAQLESIVRETVRAGGDLVIPTFALERAQEIVYHFSRLVHEGRMKPLPVYVDSPLACDVTDVFRQFPTYLDEEAQRLIQSGEAPDRFPGLHYACSVQESKAIAGAEGSKIILAGSGMCTGGRIKHHLRANLERPESTILFVGFQAKGTLGRLILDRADDVRVHGRWYEVRARVAQIFGLSAHGDRDDLLRWISHFDPAPRRLFLTHGELAAAESLRSAIAERTGVTAEIPEYRTAAEID
jgi:metallo-beta-lactamase family protein